MVLTIIISKMLVCKKFVQTIDFKLYKWLLLERYSADKITLSKYQILSIDLLTSVEFDNRCKTKSGGINKIN